MAEQAEWTDQFIGQMKRAKSTFQNVNVSYIADEWYITRSLSRREYRALTQEQANLMQKELEASQEQGMNPEAVRATLNMVSEEGVAILGTVYPQLDKDSVRNKPSGVATTLHNTILATSGYQDNPVPIKI